jgi:hypothetical protein
MFQNLTWRNNRLLPLSFNSFAIYLYNYHAKYVIKKILHLISNGCLYIHQNVTDGSNKKGHHKCQKIVIEMNDKCKKKLKMQVIGTASEQKKLTKIGP